MTRPETRGFQKPIHTTPRKAGKSSIAMITDAAEGAISCNCGWVKVHPRKKVREDCAEAHLNDKHGGMGVWL